jgi:hypothetical protein
MCGNEICNILEEYGGQISSDLENKAKFYSSDISSSHIVDIALGKDNASEIDTEGRNEDFLWEDMGN